MATTLFTAAFRLGDPITPQVLQKLQPLIAVALAALLLGERLSARYALFAVPVLVGAWLLAFPDPLGVSVSNAQAALLAVGAAALWAAGTVLGRAASADLRFADITALRFGVGLLTLLALSGATRTSLAIRLDAAPNLLLLAAVPGLLALLPCYRALGHTPASRATLDAR
ncbi:MAG: EamA family transporter [Terracoccus sp.]